MSERAEVSEKSVREGAVVEVRGEWTIKDQQGKLVASKVTQISSQCTNDGCSKRGVPSTWEREVKARHQLEKCPQLVALYEMSYASSTLPEMKGQFEDATVTVEYMDIGSFQDVVRACQGPVPPEIISYVFSQALVGVEHLHCVWESAHQNITPRNVLLNSAGDVKLTDFRSPRSKEMACDPHTFTTVKESVKYQSPECLVGTVTNAMDIWSLGLFCYFLAMASEPYSEHYSQLDGSQQSKQLSNPLFFQKLVKELDPPVPPESKVSPDLRRVLETCMTKDYTQRPSAQDLLKTDWFQKTEQYCGTQEFKMVLKEWIGQVKLKVSEWRQAETEELEKKLGMDQDDDQAWLDKELDDL